MPEPLAEAVLRCVWRARTNEPPFPEPVTFLGEMISRTADSLDSPSALAVLRAVCNPVAVEPLVAEPKAETTAVLTLVDDSLDSPELDALLGAVCSAIAASPAVAPPDAVALLRNVITSLRLLEEPVPFPVALRGAVCRPVDVLFPSAEAEAVLGAVWRPIAWSPAVAEPKAVAPRSRV